MKTKIKRTHFLALMLFAGFLLNAQVTLSFKKNGKREFHRFEIVEEYGWIWFRQWNSETDYKDFQVEGWKFRKFGGYKIRIFDGEVKKIRFIANKIRQIIVIKYYDHRDVFTELVDYGPEDETGEVDMNSGYE